MRIGKKNFPLYEELQQNAFLDFLGAVLSPDFVQLGLLVHLVKTASKLDRYFQDFA